MAVVASASAAVLVCSGPIFPQADSAMVACAEPTPPAVPEAEGPGRGAPSPVVEEVADLGSAGPELACSEPEVDPQTGARRVPVQDPSGDALRAFHQALSATEVASEGEPAVARIAFFGDSHTASDLMTGRLRRLLQERFGDAGHGFVAAGRPFRSYRHDDVQSGELGTWEAYRVRQPRGRLPSEENNRLGLAGLVVEAERPGSAVWVATSTEGPVGRTASRFEVFYMTQPRGGRINLSLDGTMIARLSSRSPSETPAYFDVDVPDGPHELRVEAGGAGLARIFGFVAERPGPGVVLDSLGINGARVTTILAWDRELLAEHLGRRDPDLVVLWYGTNEAGDDWYSLVQYEQWVIDALSVLRRAAPGASCLFVGPPDMGRVSLSARAEDLATPPRLLEVMEAQRDAAELSGCAYWSAFDAMGGRDSIATWVSLVPPLAGRDGIHLSRAGYELLADLLFAALMDDYERYAERSPPR